MCIIHVYDEWCTNVCTVTNPEEPKSNQMSTLQLFDNL